MRYTPLRAGCFLGKLTEESAINTLLSTAAQDGTSENDHTGIGLVKLTTLHFTMSQSAAVFEHLTYTTNILCIDILHKPGENSPVLLPPIPRAGAKIPKSGVKESVCCRIPGSLANTEKSSDRYRFNVPIDVSVSFSIHVSRRRLMKILRFFCIIYIQFTEGRHRPMSS